MAAQILASIGHHGFHGLSAAFDFSEACGIFRDEKTEGDPLKILLVHPGDIRHILATIARRRRRRRLDSSRSTPLRPIHFYLLESPIEVLARNIMLLEVVNDYEVPIRQRASVFLEIFGNCKVQDRTSRYIEQLGHQLRSLVTDGVGRLEDVIDLSLLRYRERDDLETTFKNYSRGVPFDVVVLRDHRLRGFYGDRYDNRKALADWDYHNNIRGKASIIHIKQYIEWRHSGVAFEFGDQVYTESNRTMISYAEGVMKKGKEKGMKKEVRGLWTDIVASPYFSFGIDCETTNKFSEGLFEIYNKNTGSEQHRHHTVEIALYSLLSYLWEIETGQIYRMTKEHDIYSGLGAEGNPSVIEDEEDFSTDEIVPSEKLVETEDEVRNSKLEHIKEGDVRVVELDSKVDDKLKIESKETKNNANDCKNEVGEGDKNQIESEESNDLISAQTSLRDLTLPENVEFKNIHLMNDVIGGDEMERKSLAKQIQRAECIAESLNGIKVFPLLGSTSILDKQKYHNLFDGVFVSARSAQCVEMTYFKKLLKMNSKQKNNSNDKDKDKSSIAETGLTPTQHVNENQLGSVIAIETAKFLVPLSKKQQKEFNLKEEEYASINGWTKIPSPVPRRRRDELDLEEDVVFYQN